MSNGLHNRLCHMAAKWLRSKKNCVFSVAEVVATSSEIPDAIGFKAWDTIIVEVKVSRADFLKDKAKRVRLNPSQGMGRLRYYLCPVGMIHPDEVPEKWGLLYTDEKRISEVKQAYFQDSAKDCELNMAVSVIRRFFEGCPYIGEKLYRGQPRKWINSIECGQS
jgi:hypothetical protein